jgi:hypothetical protein
VHVTQCGGLIRSRIFGGNSNKPEIFLAKESNVDLRKYSGDAQEFLSLIKMVGHHCMSVRLSSCQRGSCEGTR